MVYRWSDNPHVPIDVDLCRIDLENLLDYPNDNGESLVDFEKRDIINCKICSLKSLGKSDSGRNWEVNWCQTGIGICFFICKS